MHVLYNSHPIRKAKSLCLSEDERVYLKDDGDVSMAIIPGNNMGKYPF